MNRLKKCIVIKPASTPPRLARMGVGWWLPLRIMQRDSRSRGVFTTKLRGQADILIVQFTNK